MTTPRASCSPDVGGPLQGSALHDEIIRLREKDTGSQCPLDASLTPMEEGNVSNRERELRTFCRRVFGDDAGRADEVVQTLLAVASRGTAIALRGELDLVPIAYALHRQMFGPERPFVVCDPRRREGNGSVRSPPNRRTGAQALAAAKGGSVCLRASRLPRDFDTLAAALRGESSAATVFVCLRDRDRIRDLLCPPIEVPHLPQRASDLGRLLDEYLQQAARTLRVGDVRLSESARNVILGHITSLAEFEKTAVRLVALLSTPNMSHAALLLDMAPVSLARWAHRRGWTAAFLRDVKATG